MSRTRLNQHRVEKLKPRNKTYDIRDGVLKGFGLRVLPSGKKHYFVHTQHHRQRIWKHIADAGAITEPEARARATSVLASIRNAERGIDVLPEQIVFERVAEEVFQRYQRHWKPATLKVNRELLQKPDTALVQGQANCRHHPPRRAAMVCLPSRNAGRGRPLRARAFRHHDPGGGLRVSPTDQQSLLRYQTIPTARA